MRVVCEIDGQRVATFALSDRIKAEARAVFDRILEQGISLAVATGDRRAAAERVVRELGLALDIEAECTPARKLDLIRVHQSKGQIVGMVGDGINDAPALAQADVGLVFAHEARTASSEAADIVLLGGEIQQVWQAFSIARQTIRVATQGILLGIGLSVVAMLAASAGLLPPLTGAFLQEGIDVLVIINALRATSGASDHPAPHTQTLADAFVPDSDRDVSPAVSRVNPPCNVDRSTVPRNRVDRLAQPGTGLMRNFGDRRTIADERERGLRIHGLD